MLFAQGMIRGMSHDATLPLPSRALSLKAPYAWAVIHGDKDVENRTWWTEIRGDFWIASSAQVTSAYFQSACETIKRVAPHLKVPPLEEHVLGAIIGRASIVDCILPGGLAFVDKPHAQAARSNYLIGMRRDPAEEGTPLFNFAKGSPMKHELHPMLWHFLDQYGYVLKDRRAVAKPVACKGHQRWWTVSPEILERLERQAA